MQKNYKNSYKATEKELVSLSVYNVGLQRCDPLHQWGPGIRDHYLIHYVISGKGYYRLRRQQYELCGGDTFLVYPDREVLYYADADDPWEYAWVGFTGSDASIILKAAGFSPEQPFLKNIPFGDAVHRQILRIYDARGNEFEHAVEMTGRLYTMLALFLHGASHSGSRNSANSYVQKSIEFIASNYSYAITVEDIADYVGVSRSHLFRSFETVLGQSPKEYLTDYRMKQACYLLEHSDLSITAIANSLGFDNSLYFSKTFHRKKEMSPKEYRGKAKKCP